MLNKNHVPFGIRYTELGASFAEVLHLQSLPKYLWVGLVMKRATELDGSKGSDEPCALL